MNRSTHLASILLSALDTTYGLRLKITGSCPKRRAQAISALQAAKRELIPDHPETLNLVIKAFPGTDDIIAIRLLPPQE